MESVVEDDNFDRQLMHHGRRHFLHVHLNTAIAGDTEDQPAGKRGLRPHGGRKPEPHGPKTPRGQPAVRLCQLKVLGGPHLVLPDIGRHDGVQIFREFIEPLDNVLRLNRTIRRLLIRKRIRLLPFANLIPPGLA